MTHEEALSNLTSDPIGFPNVDVWGSLSTLSGKSRHEVKVAVFKSIPNKNLGKAIKGLIPTVNDSEKIASNIVSWLEKVQKMGDGEE